MSASLVAFGAISALGEGREACSAGSPGHPARVAIARDAELERAGLERPFMEMEGPDFRQHSKRAEFRSLQAPTRLTLRNTRRNG